MSGARPTVTVLADPRPEFLPPFHLPAGQYPAWAHVDEIVADLAAHDGVSAPPQFVAGLQGVVADARSKGLDLSIVYTDEPMAVYTQARDLATFVSQHRPGTILVRTPDYVGSVSDTVPRARLEAGQDDAFHESNPVTAAVVFEHKVVRPGPSWPAVTGTLAVVIALAVAALVYLIRRRQA